MLIKFNISVNLDNRSVAKKSKRYLLTDFSIEKRNEKWIKNSAGKKREKRWKIAIEEKYLKDREYK